MATIDELGRVLGGFRGRRVLVRSDLNVPLEGGVITDTAGFARASPRSVS
jgi:phosphoglycerate kinase